MTTEIRRTLLVRSIKSLNFYVLKN